MNVVELRPGEVSGGMTFSNRLLRLTASFGDRGPTWQINPQPVKLNGRKPNVIHASFEPLKDSFDGSFGSIGENEHGLTGEFYFDAPYFDLLQQAALSAADLDLTVNFAAHKGRVEVLMLTLQHKSA